MTVTIANLYADCGEVYDNLTNGTTAATALLSKAGAEIALITGTTTGFDLPVRNLADAHICQQVLGGSAGASISLGSISIGRKGILEMRERFIKSVSDTLALSGYTFKVGNFMVEKVNG